MEGIIVEKRIRISQSFIFAIEANGEIYSVTNSDDFPLSHGDWVEFDFTDSSKSYVKIRRMLNHIHREGSEMINYTDAQLNIFKFIKEGREHGIIDAVAGAGKTTTLIGCADYVPTPSDTLFCAFNKSIAMEITEKFKKAKHPEIVVKTIHALGYQILTDNFQKKDEKFKIKEDKYSTILDSKDFFDSIRNYVDTILKFHGNKSLDELKLLGKMSRDLMSMNQKNELNEGERRVREIKNKMKDIVDKFRLSLTKEDDFNAFKEMCQHYSLFTDDEFSDEKFDCKLKAYRNAVLQLLKEGNSIAKSHLLVDFTDMIYLPEIWDNTPNRLYGFIFVDECQDLSKAQLRIVSKYLRSNGRLLAVGDPYQSIYGFAGADAKSYDRIKRVFKAKDTTVP